MWWCIFKNEYRAASICNLFRKILLFSRFIRKSTVYICISLYKPKYG